MSTMSVRVLSPAVLRKIRTPRGGNGRAPAIVGVRRNLFGSPGAAAKALADLELNRATDEGCLRWGFDFRAECPLAGRNRFEWKRIGPKQTILRPDVISSSSAIVAPMEVELHPTQKIEKKTKPDLSKIQKKITDFICPDVISIAPAITTPIVVPMEVELQPTQKVQQKTKPDPSKIQKTITDFLKPRRKRPASGDSAPPAKLLRPSSPLCLTRSAPPGEGLVPRGHSARHQ